MRFKSPVVLATAIALAVFMGFAQVHTVAHAVPAALAAHDDCGDSPVPQENENHPDCGLCILAASPQLPSATVTIPAPSTSYGAPDSWSMAVAIPDPSDHPQSRRGPPPASPLL